MGANESSSSHCAVLQTEHFPTSPVGDLASIAAMMRLDISGENFMPAKHTPPLILSQLYYYPCEARRSPSV